MTADLSSVTSAGVQSVNITTSYTDRKFNQSNTTIDKQSIYLATVNICELSHKEVELRCELTGNVAEGYSAGKVQLSQTAIEVRGQEDDIAVISYAKVVFDVGKNAKETVTASLDYKFYDAEGHEVRRPRRGPPRRPAAASRPGSRFRPPPAPWRRWIPDRAAS